MCACSKAYALYQRAVVSLHCQCVASEWDKHVFKSIDQPGDWNTVSNLFFDSKKHDSNGYSLPDLWGNAMSDRKLCEILQLRKTKAHDELLEHLLYYSPELVPSDYHLFWYQKSFLGDQRFNNDKEVETAVKVGLSSHAAAFYEELQKFVGRSRKKYEVSSKKNYFQCFF